MVMSGGLRGLASRGRWLHRSAGRQDIRDEHVPKIILCKYKVYFILDEASWLV